MLVSEATVAEKGASLGLLRNKRFLGARRHQVHGQLGSLALQVPKAALAVLFLVVRST